ncbi:MAG: hypothetical protein HXX09_16690 [Bacteroidetes bacterium]|nr:hypothetical protein [Bacteroidota bacterium]
MTKKIQSFIICFIFSISIYAQIPGYLGKRFVPSISADLWPSLIGPTNSSDQGLNFTPSLNLDYVTGKHSQISVSYQRISTGLSLLKDSEELMYTNTTPSQTYYYYLEYKSGYSKNSSFKNKPIQLTSNNFSIGFKLFYGGSYSPVGNYVKPEFSLLFENVSYDKFAFRPNNPTSDTTLFLDFSKKAIGRGEYQFTSFVISFTAGRQRVLFDKLLIDYGVRIGMAPLAILSKFSFKDDENQSIGKMEEHIKKDSDDRMLRFQLISLHLGIGLVSF